MGAGEGANGGRVTRLTVEGGEGGPGGPWSRTHRSPSGTSQALGGAAVPGGHEGAGRTPFPGTWGCGRQAGPGSITPRGSEGTCPPCAQMGILSEPRERFPLEERRSPLGGDRAGQYSGDGGTSCPLLPPVASLLPCPGDGVAPADEPPPALSSRSSSAEDFCYVFVVELERGPSGLGMGLIDGMVSGPLGSSCSGPPHAGPRLARSLGDHGRAGRGGAGPAAGSGPRSVGQLGGA